LVPPGTHPAIANEGNAVLKGEAKEDAPTVDLSGRAILVYPKDSKHLKRKDIEGNLREVEPRFFVSPQKGVGTLYIIILLLVIVITNIHFRGLWSVVVMLVLIMTSILFAVAGWWESIFTRISLLGIHINLGGYLFLSTVLLILW